MPRGLDVGGPLSSHWSGEGVCEVGDLVVLPCKSTDSPRALVVVGSWLNTKARWHAKASQKTADKYCDLYRARGCMVLFFRTNAAHLVAGERAALQLLTAINLVLARKPCPIILVGFSGAMYIFGALLTLLADESWQTCVVRRHLAGFLADSPIHQTDTVRGIASVVSGDVESDVPLRHPLSHWALRAAVWCATTAAWPWIGASHLRSNRNVETLPAHLLVYRRPCQCGSSFENSKALSIPSTSPPIAVIYCKNDRVADHHTIERLIATTFGDVAHVLCFERSRHAAHLQLHEPAYTAFVLQHLDQCLAWWDARARPPQAPSSAAAAQTDSGLPRTNSQCPTCGSRAPPGVREGTPVVAKL